MFEQDAAKVSDLDKLAAALVKAQIAFPTVERSEKVTVRTKTGGSYEFKYAPFENIVAAIRKPLSDNGLAFMQYMNGSVVSGPQGVTNYVRTILLHASGQRFVSGGTPVIYTGTDPQAYGSALTYAKRYDLSLTLGIATEDDDDGTRARDKGEGKGAGAQPSNKNGDKDVDKKFLATLQVAAGVGMEKLRKTWEGGTAAQRKGLRPTLESLKIVAQAVDDASKS